MYRADPVAPGLWQGPRPMGDLSKKFDVLVLCALEYQPRDGRVVVQTVLHAPMDDAELTREEGRLALDASRYCASAIKQGRRVLTTCHMGLNRSGLVSALTLMRLWRSPDEAIAAVRRARGPHALSNPSFTRFIESLRSAERRAA